MIALTRLSLRRRGVTLLLALFVVVGGAMALGSLDREFYPPSEPPFLVVTAMLPGASPEAVVDGLTRPIEEALQASAGVRHVDSTSLEGRVVVSADTTSGST